MDLGDFDTQVRVQQRAPGTDAHGMPDGDWTDVCTPWANVRHAGGLESIRAGAPTSTVQASIRLCGYRTDLHAGMRVVEILESTVYDIQAVLPDKAGREHVDLVCQLVPVVEEGSP